MNVATCPIVIFWDVDGTLLSTARAGIRAFEDAVLEVLDVETGLADLPTAGLTDRRIARAILLRLNIEPDDTVERMILDVYTRQLPERLRERRGGVLKGVTELLEHLSGLDNVVNALLTGNMRAGADAKLESYGLSSFFELGGFADDGFDRPEIARVAMTRVVDKVGPLNPRRIFLVGDTPDDVRCARSVGLRAVAVASGIFSVADLETHGPWWALPSLPSPTVFLERLRSLP